MKKLFILFVFSIFVFSIITSFPVLAHDSRDFTTSSFRQINTSFGVEFFPYSYKEPGLMKYNGNFYGLHGSIAYELSTGFFIKPELRLAKGTTDYFSYMTGSSKTKIPNNLFETRVLLKKVFYLPYLSSISPFIGIGYRYKEDNASHLITSTGHLGYQRESTYYYLPIGLEVERSFLGNYGVLVVGEYDLFLSGKQKSYTSPTFINHQHKGFGVKAEILLIKTFDNYKLKVGPFVNYWNIKQSKISYYYNSPEELYSALEPKNTTKEIGIKFDFSI